MTEQEWHDLVKGMLKAEMKRRNMTYEQLAAKLAEIGVQRTAGNLRNKVAEAGSRPCSSCSALGRLDVRCFNRLTLVDAVGRGFRGRQLNRKCKF